MEEHLQSLEAACGQHVTIYKMSSRRDDPTLMSDKPVSLSLGILFMQRMLNIKPNRGI